MAALTELIGSLAGGLPGAVAAALSAVIVDLGPEVLMFYDVCNGVNIDITAVPGMSNGVSSR